MIRNNEISSSHYVSDTPFDEKAIDAIKETTKSIGFWTSVWHNLRRRPLFYTSGLVIIFIILVAAFPALFTSADPVYGDIARKWGAPEPGHPLGYDFQGYDMLARLVYGTRPSFLIGVCVTAIVTLFGGILGAIAGYYRGWFDTILSRIVDIFYAIPLLLGAVVVLQTMKNIEGIWKLVVVLSIFGWVSNARMMRGKVLETSGQEFITASLALGATKLQILFKHVIPNSIGPVIVTSTVGLGTTIVAESTLSFLGLGIGGKAPSWGHDIQAATAAFGEISQHPQGLLLPSAALAITVLAFIILGDVVSEAIDPKGRR